jgi:nitronate monooxygenase
LNLQSELANQFNEGVTMWPDNRILDLFNIELPIIQAPMAGSDGRIG